MKHQHRKAALFALLLLGVTASALPRARPLASSKSPRPLPSSVAPRPSFFTAQRQRPGLSGPPTRLGRPPPLQSLQFRRLAPRFVLRKAEWQLSNSGQQACRCPMDSAPLRSKGRLPLPTIPIASASWPCKRRSTRIVHGGVLGRLRVGMRVLDLATGHVLYTRRGSVLMDPASNQKVLATATALLRLGSTWRFRTELSGPPPTGMGPLPAT